MVQASPQQVADRQATKELIQLFQAIIDNLEKRRKAVAKARKARDDEATAIRGVEAVVKKLDADFKKRLDAIYDCKVCKWPNFIGKGRSKSLGAKADYVHKTLWQMEKQLERRKQTKRELDAKLKKLEAAYEQANRFFVVQRQQTILNPRSR